MIESIARRRLRNLRIASPTSGGIVQIVTDFGAVQAQDYAAARWALALRVRGANEADVDGAFDAGRLLRTHVMRPTWQFVAPSTIGWLIELTAPRVHQACGFLNRQVGLDASMRRKSQRAIRNALGGGHHLTRREIAAVLEKSGLGAAGLRLAAILLAAELDGVVCSGPRRGKHFTYALYEERVAPAAPLSRERAVEDLARRYFATHGPATLRDFSWWSGLTIATAREATEMLGASLASKEVAGLTYWWMASDTAGTRRTGTVHLLPAFDEYVVGYRDRAAVPYRWPSGTRSFLGSIFAGAELVGTWRRELRGGRVALEGTLLRPPSGKEKAALRGAVKRYSAFAAEPHLTTRGLGLDE